VLSFDCAQDGVCGDFLSIFNSALVGRVLKKALPKLKILVTKAGGAKKL
jgi:hypothetical protein